LVSFQLYISKNSTTFTSWQHRSIMPTTAVGYCSFQSVVCYDQVMEVAGMQQLLKTMRMRKLPFAGHVLRQGVYNS